MKMISIRSVRNSKILIRGQFRNIKACLENAVAQSKPLSLADLRRKNLASGRLDGAVLQKADFTASNLTGANLSEAELTGARFQDCDLYNTCFAYSTLRHCNFTGASFGGTDLTGADISFSVFSTLSALAVDFVSVKAMQGCVFINPDGTFSRMSRPPVVISGLPKPVVFFDDHLKIGQDLHEHGHWVALMNAAANGDMAGKKFT